MPGPVHLVYGESLLAYRLSEGHPLQPLRVQLTFEAITRLGLLERCHLVPPRAATDDELALCHEPAYVDTVRRLSSPDTRRLVPYQVRARAGFAHPDNPVADGMHQACAQVVGASLVGAEAIASGAALHAFSPAGGLHHAQRDRASGFCVYNDVAVAIARLRGLGHRVACVDVDVHHGDGTQALFYDDPEVLTVSLHESGRYLFPGTGFPDEAGGAAAPGTAANLPFSAYAWDEPWLAGFEAVVPSLLRSFQPTVLVTQDGCDSHLLDPLAHLRNSTRIWPHVGRRLHELAHELCGGRWLALGGGGYAIREVVPRAWSLLFAEMVESPEMAVECLDHEAFPPSAEVRELVWQNLKRDLEDLAGHLPSIVTALPSPPAPPSGTAS